MRIFLVRFLRSSRRFALTFTFAGLAACGSSVDLPQQGNPDAHPILGISNFAPGQVTVISDNQLADGDVVTIAGTSSYNGSYTVFAVSPRTFAIRATFVGNEARGTQTRASGAVFGCTTAGNTAQIGLSRTASRIRGVAPLSVFFDARATTSPLTTRPFHELDVRWDFGDTASGNWATGARTGMSRNVAAGPLAGHVFERPGVYRISVAVTDGTNSVTDDCLEIAVQDPDVIYAGNDTICIGSGTLPVAGAGGCPAGASVATDASFCNAVNARLATGKRLLFDAAGLFSCSTNALISANGPWTIGAFPVVPNAGARATVVTNRTSDGGILRIGAGAGVFPADGRIMNLDFSWLPATASTARVDSITATGNFDRLTLLRLDVHDISDGLRFALPAIDLPGNDHVWDHLAVVDSRFRRITGGAGRQGILASASRLMLFGNLVDDTSAAAQAVRFDHLDRAVIAYNTYTDGPAGAATLAVRGAEQNPAGATYAQHVLPAPSPTQYVVVSDNDVSIEDAYGFAASPPDAGIVVAVRDLVSERNAYWAPITTACGGGACAQAAVATQATRHTIRNEIVHFGNFRSYSMVHALGASTGTPAANGIDLFHNTAFGALNSLNGTADMAQLQAGVANVRIRNNLMYVPGVTLSTAVAICVGGCAGMVGLEATANSTDTSNGDQMRFSNPNFSGTPLPPIAAGAWKAVASYASTGTGTAAPVFSDFFGTARTTPKLGAVVP